MRWSARRVIWMETEFVCIPRPVERSDRADGGPILYRVKYRAKLWGRDEQPELKGGLGRRSSLLGLISLAESWRQMDAKTREEQFWA